MSRRQPITWASVSQCRGQLMGVAIILIVLFHIPLPASDAFFGLKRMGNVGVDVFFFLSGIGLWFAWCKNASVGHFYKRRLVRILPAWLVVATAFYLPDYLGEQRFSSSVIDLVGDITINWDFWCHDELTFWYIPATMALYLLAPWYMRLIQRSAPWRYLPVLMMVWCVAVQYVPPVHQAVGHIEIFWSRVPIFFIGIVAGQWVRDRQTLDRQALPLLWLTVAMTLGLCIWLEQTVHGRFPIFVERMVYIPLTMAGVLLASQYLCRVPDWAGRALGWVGGVSLEVYLLHCHFILVHIQPLHLGYWPTAVLCLAATLPLAWLLHKIIDTLIKAIHL